MNQTIIHDFFATNFFPEDYFPDGIPVIPPVTTFSRGYNGRNTYLSQMMGDIVYNRFSDVREEDEEEIILQFIAMIDA